jgi:hypothetical protein
VSQTRPSPQSESAEQGVVDASEPGPPCTHAPCCEPLVEQKSPESGAPHSRSLSHARHVSERPQTGVTPEQFTLDRHAEARCSNAKESAKKMAHAEERTKTTLRRAVTHHAKRKNLPILA